MTTAVRPAVAGPAAPLRRPPAAAPRWWADAAGVAVGASLLVVTALWVRNGGVRQVSSGGPPMVFAVGRLAGLLASDLLLVQVLLMARIPVLERAFGQPRLTRWHRWTGSTSFHLMLLHLQWTVLGSSAATRTGFFAELARLVSSGAGMLLAAVGSGLLVLVAVTSVRAARRRLRYESWHALHLYAYLGIGLALPHQIGTGTEFVGSPAARAYWWTLYALAAGAVVVYRIGVPVWRNRRHRLTVRGVVPEAPGITSVHLTGRRLDRLPVRAGQYFLWRFLDGPGWTRAHPFSLSAAPRDDGLRITVRDVGDGSARIARLRPGTRVLFEGPFGKLTGETYPGGPVVLLACGIGITPLLALLGELPYGRADATLVYRARSADEAAFGAELGWFAEHRGVRVVHLIGPRAGDSSWLPATLAGHGDVAELRRIAPDIARAQVYVCGPEAWAGSVRAAARAAGVPDSRLHTELFSR
ncbi:ferredoxin reductase family protein [Jidongwangia harbinensis]|uniref:ferredoxin reductase family protein n=1 Tax=Jidongwangia harbinensis TaxID=2878561 RepID=UPI001CDA3445|nr:ferredoxin reductase family protein [Jidongwangia harbinensis]MCA2213382.1 ferric reductase-like transmembrane domain-containing protein [Jidongwangia harbinensis]